MSLPESRPGSKETIVDLDTGSASRSKTTSNKDGHKSHRKGNPDSGFHEESIHSSATTPSTSSEGHHRGHHERARRKHSASESEHLPSTAGTSHGKKTRHADSNASIITNFSGNQELYDIDNVSSEDGGGTTEIDPRREVEATAAGLDDSSNNDFAGTSGKKRGKHFPPTPPPTSEGRSQPGGVKPGQSFEYEIPSDTELAEIIAIMSGLATPKRQKSEPELNVQSQILKDASTNPSVLNVDPPRQELSLLEPVPRQRRPAPPALLKKQQSLVTRDSNGRLYEKRNTSHTNNIGNGGGMGNGTVPNGVAGKRYLTHQGSKSIDGGSWPNSNNGSMTDLRIVSGKSHQSMNSLNSILAASKAGYIGPNKKKKKKPKPPPPPKKDDDGTDYTEPKRSWKQRLKFGLTLIVSITLILACSSLLFIVPLIVDPILVGLEAEFTNAPVQCQTIAKRNATGAGNCTVPSCREGCTADLMFCYYIEVQYQNRVYNASAKYISYHPPPLLLNPVQGMQDTTGYYVNSSSANSTSTLGIPDEFTTQTYPFFPDVPIQEGILLVNPMGCGYPPDLNCTEFEKKFGEIGHTFPCYYSQQNETIVVPEYDRAKQVANMSFALVVPCSLSLICSILLYLLLRWNPKSTRKKKKTKTEKKKVEEKVDGIESSASKSSRQAKNSRESEQEREEKAKRAANGVLGNIVGNLSGLSSNNVLKKRNYSKFSPTHLKREGGESMLLKETSLDTELERMEGCQVAGFLTASLADMGKSGVFMNGHAGAGRGISGMPSQADRVLLGNGREEECKSGASFDAGNAVQKNKSGRVNNAIWNIEDEVGKQNKSRADDVGAGGGDVGGMSGQGRNTRSKNEDLGRQHGRKAKRKSEGHEDIGESRRKSIDSMDTRTDSAKTLSFGKI